MTAADAAITLEAKLNAFAATLTPDERDLLVQVVWLASEAENEVQGFGRKAGERPLDYSPLPNPNPPPPPPPPPPQLSAMLAGLNVSLPAVQTPPGPPV